MASTARVSSDSGDPGLLLVHNVDFAGCDLCGENHDTDQCPILSAGQKVSDTSAPSRARLTLPKTLEVEDLVDGTTTVITKESIATNTQFGPFEAPKSPNLNRKTRFQLKVFEKDGTFVYLDGNDEKSCNWMSLVAIAKNKTEQNLVAYQVKHSVYFSALDTISPGEELKVWYAPHYGKKMGISAPWENSPNDVESETPTVSNVPVITASQKRTQVVRNYFRGRRGRKKRPLRKKKPIRRADDDEDYEVQAKKSRKEVVQKLDPRRLGFKEVHDWKCSQCGLVFTDCLEFAHHLSDHYKPRQSGTKRRDSEEKNADELSCHICDAKFADEESRDSHMKSCTGEQTGRDANSERRKNDESMTAANLDKENNQSDGIEGMLNVEITVLNPPSMDQANDPTTIIINQRKLKIDSEGVMQLVAENENTASRSRRVSEKMNAESKPAAVIEKKVVAQTLESVVRRIINSDDFDSDEDDHDGLSEFDSSHDNDSSGEGGAASGSGKQGKYECDICHKCFDKSIYLYRHIRKHTGDFTCLKCLKVFARKESMLKHACPGRVSEDYDPSLVCNMCNKTYANERLLKRHIAKHTGEFNCSDCGKACASNEDLESHVCADSSVSERYTCDICQKTFSKLKYLDKHIPVHTGVFSCPICGKWLRSNDSLINHMRICGQVRELEANGTAVCPHCKEEFNDLKAFRRHMFDHTHMYVCESCGARFRNRMSLGLHVCNAERTVSCSECGKEFNSIAALNTHRATHGEPQFHCETCGRSYHRKEALLKHPCEKVKRSRGRSQKKPPSLQPLICEVCGSMFSSTSSLNVHRNLHGEKKFSCDVCGKRFHRKDLLLEHMAVHGHPEIPCPVCSKLFKTKKSLDVHLLIHEGVKRFKCQTCGKMFYQKGNLQKHEETHTPGRRHLCPHCPKTFSSKEYLTIHISEHTRGRIFVCATCGRSFVKEHQLKAHRRVFHGNQAYVCKYCGISVKLRHSLKRHLEKKHTNMRHEWDDSSQLGEMLMRKANSKENEEEILEYQGQETIITEVSPTQGAEVLLAVAGIGSAALQEAIASGTARIQPGAAPNTIEISLPVGTEGLTEANVLPDSPESASDAHQPVIQHVVSGQQTLMNENGEPQQIHIVSTEDGLSQIVMQPGQEQALSDGNAIVLENGTILQSAANCDNPADLLLYVLTTSETQES